PFARRVFVSVVDAPHVARHVPSRLKSGASTPRAQVLRMFAFAFRSEGGYTMYPKPQRFEVEVKLMDDPCLWRWEIKDTVRGSIVQSSWDQEWAAYPSREEAYRAAQDRLRSV